MMVCQGVCASPWLLCGEDDTVKELKGYNDYVEIVKRYMSQYGRMRGTAESMRMRAKTIREELSKDFDIAAPISKYGDQVGGGSPELNAVEAAADRRAKTAKMAAMTITATNANTSNASNWMISIPSFRMLSLISARSTIIPRSI